MTDLHKSAFERALLIDFGMMVRSNKTGDLFKKLNTIYLINRYKKKNSVCQPHLKYIN